MHWLHEMTWTDRSCKQQVTDLLHADPAGVLARMLNTPLMLSLSRYAYSHKRCPLPCRHVSEGTFGEDHRPPGAVQLCRRVGNASS